MQYLDALQGADMRVRPECIEDARRPDQHVGLALLAQPDKLGDNTERQEMREIGDGVEGPGRDQLVDMPLGKPGKPRLKRRQRRRHQRPREDVAQLAVLRIVGAQHHPFHRVVCLVIHHAAVCRGENLAVAQSLAHAVVTGDGPGVVAAQPDRRAKVAQLLVVRIRVADHLVGPEVFVEGRRRQNVTHPGSLLLQRQPGAGRCPPGPVPA